MGSPKFPTPKGGASLILTFKLQSKTTLILGSNPLAATRAFSALEADSQVTMIAKGGHEGACEELKWRASRGQLVILDWAALPSTSTADGEGEIRAFETYLATSKEITLVCVTDTIISTGQPHPRSRASAAQIHRLCQTHGIPINISDMPDLCDFSFASVHRFVDPTSGEGTPLQVAVTSNGQGCRLAGRLRREIVAGLPKDVGRAVENMGRLRTMAKIADAAVGEVDSELNEESGVTTPNRPVPTRSLTESAPEVALRRMKWVAQVSEYWPLLRLARMSDVEMQEVLNDGERFAGGAIPPSEPGKEGTRHSLALSTSLRVSRGKILLVGSGPGHPSLLTLATHAALTKHAHLVLSDKLVPAAVLALIPPQVEVRIARKFPGNAEGAQNEMMEAAIEAAGRGLTVVRVCVTHYAINAAC